MFFSLDSGDTWHEWSEGMRDDRGEGNVNSLFAHDGYLLAGTYYPNCSANECFDPLGRIWQRPLNEVVSIGDRPVANGLVAGLKVLQSAGGIEFTLGKSGWVELSIYTPDGKLAATLVQGDYEAGTHRVLLGAGDLPGGLYLARLKAPGISHAQKVLLED